MKFNPENQECLNLDLEKNYSFKRCDSDGKGALIPEDDKYFPRFILFDENNKWKARTDHIDFNTGAVETEILLLDKDSLEFFLEIKKTKRKEILEQLSCVGKLEALDPKN